MAHGEIHLELSVDYADDDKLRALAAYGKRARPTRDLYVQMLCYCKRKMTDGHVPAEQVGILAYPDSLKDGLKDAELLIAVGLAEQTPGGYYVPGFLKRNKSRQEIGAAALAKKAGAALGNHRRWHDESPDPSCVHCTDAGPIATPIGGPNPLLTRSESTKSKSESESESKTESVATESPKRPRSKGTKTGPPDVFPITEQMSAWGREHCPQVTDPQAETRQFLDHARANGKTFIDWTAAWRTWMSNAQKYAAQRSNVRPIAGSRQAPPGTHPHLAHLYEQS